MAELPDLTSSPNPNEAREKIQDRTTLNFSKSYLQIEKPITGVLLKAPYTDGAEFEPYTVPFIFKRGVEEYDTESPDVTLGGYVTIFHLWKEPLEQVSKGLKPEPDDQLFVEGIYYTIMSVLVQSRGWRYRCTCRQNVKQDKPSR